MKKYNVRSSEKSSPLELVGTRKRPGHLWFRGVVKSQTELAVLEGPEYLVQKSGQLREKVGEVAAVQKVRN